MKSRDTGESDVEDEIGNTNGVRKKPKRDKMREKSRDWELKWSKTEEVDRNGKLGEKMRCGTIEEIRTERTKERDQTDEEEREDVKERESSCEREEEQN